MFFLLILLYFIAGPCLNPSQILKKDTITVSKERKVVSVFLNNVFELVL